MNLQNKKIGIWGLGVSGKSAINFLSPTARLQVTDQKKPSLSDKSFLAIRQCHFIEQHHLEEFLTLNDYILASPGIDLNPFKEYQHKFITELDLFQNYFRKPIIAITGTLGKTSIAYLLCQVLSKKRKILLGGNIGTGMLDLIAEKEDASYAILECSSFQLEWCRTFAPNLAIVTNFYPNHLDRHNSIENYFKAKSTIFYQQKEHQKIIAPFEIAAQVLRHAPLSRIAFFSSSKPREKDFSLYKQHELFWIDGNEIVYAKNNVEQLIYPVNALPKGQLITNWLIILAALKLLDHPLSLLSNTTIEKNETLEHRLEFCGSKNGIDFYNDSKSTIMESTISAINRLEQKPIIILLGGLSKGINRKPYFEKIKDSVKEIVTFGKEAEELASFAKENEIPTSSVNTLDNAFHLALKKCKPGEQILLSPGGSSFDLYKNYKERGKHFKSLFTNFSF